MPRTLPPLSALRPLLLVMLVGTTACAGNKASDTGGSDGADGGSDVKDLDGDGFPAGEDCDDRNAARYPGAPEYCNNADDDCDGVVDNNIADMPVWYADIDRDGYGDADEATQVQACTAPYRMIAQGGDCDDGASVSHPGALELCDDRDNDCDGDVDEGTPSNAMQWYYDEDGDGDGAGRPFATSCDAPHEGATTRWGDCDDLDGNIHPSAAEDLTDGIDNNCDGWLDLVGRWTSNIRAGIAENADEPDVFDCYYEWNGSGEFLNADELCRDCEFGFETTWTLDEDATTLSEGRCEDGGTLSYTMAFSPEYYDGSGALLYSFSYGYYGYTYVYWQPFAAATYEDGVLTYSSGYKNAYSDGDYSSAYQYGTGHVY